MNSEALMKVRDRLMIQQVYPSRISLSSHPDFEPMLQQPETSTQFAWGAREVTIQELATDDPKDNLKMVKFRAPTRARIVKGQKPAEGDYAEEDVLALIEIEFVVEYTVTGTEDLDEDGMNEFGQHNMPYHLWPYWRELLQNLAMRCRLPVPSMPSFIVQTKAKEVIVRK